MYIVSWNVAGWATTIDKIQSRYDSFENWLELHKIDILCIQEVKVTSSDLTLKPNNYGANLKNFDTFWACPYTLTRSTTKSKSNHTQQRSGLNGIATIARKGLTMKANSKALEVDILDCEGRCLMTDHGDFVIFNIYVPNSGQDHKRFPFKMKFLYHLQLAIEKQQQLYHKKVIVLGDFNIAPRAVDIYRQFRQINIQRILTCEIHPNLGKWYAVVNKDQSAVSDTNNNTQSIKERDNSNYTIHSSSLCLYSTTRNEMIHGSELLLLLEAIAYIQYQWNFIEESIPSITMEKENNNSNNSNSNNSNSNGNTKYRMIGIRSYDSKKVKIGKTTNRYREKPISLYGASITDNTIISHMSPNTTTTTTTAAVVDGGTSTSMSAESYIIKDAGYMYMDDFQDLIQAMSMIPTTTSQIQVLVENRKKLEESYVMKLPLNPSETIEYMGMPYINDAIIDKFLQRQQQQYTTSQCNMSDMTEYNIPLNYDQISKIMNYEYNVSTMKPLTLKHWELLADIFGETSHVRCSVEWYHTLCKNCQLIDTYSYHYPLQRCRFTCWEQYTNRRYYNEGSRIDHILIDQNWYTQQVQDKSVFLQGYEERNPHTSSTPNTTKSNTESLTTSNNSTIQTTGNKYHIVDSTQYINSATTLHNPSLQKEYDSYITQEQLCSLNACTAYHMFQPASFDGGGIPQACPAAYDSQFVPPHTGMIYTPPEYSDHIAVCVSLHLPITNSATCTSHTADKQTYTCILEKDEGTRCTQPHLKQTSLLTHFKSKSTYVSNVSDSTTNTTNTTNTNTNNDKIDSDLLVNGSSKSVLTPSLVTHSSSTTNTQSNKTQSSSTTTTTTTTNTTKNTTINSTIHDNHSINSNTTYMMEVIDISDDNDSDDDNDDGSIKKKVGDSFLAHENDVILKKQKVCHNTMNKKIVRTINTLENTENTIIMKSNDIDNNDISVIDQSLSSPSVSFMESYTETETANKSILVEHEKKMKKEITTIDVKTTTVASAVRNSTCISTTKASGSSTNNKSKITSYFKT